MAAIALAAVVAIELSAVERRVATWSAGEGCAVTPVRRRQGGEQRGEDLQLGDRAGDVPAPACRNRPARSRDEPSYSASRPSVRTSSWNARRLRWVVRPTS